MSYLRGRLGGYFFIDLDARISVRTFRQMENKVMKAVLNYVSEAIVLGVIAFVVLFTYLHTLEALGI